MLLSLFSLSHPKRGLTCRCVKKRGNQGEGKEGNSSYKRLVRQQQSGGSRSSRQSVLPLVFIGFKLTSLPLVTIIIVVA